MNRLAAGVILFVVLAGAGVAGWLGWAAYQRQKGSPTSGEVTIEDLRKHPFWKTAPSAAKLEEVLDLMLHPAARRLYLADDGSLWWSGEEGSRQHDRKRQGEVSPAWDVRTKTRAGAARAIISELDRIVAREDFERRIKKD